MLQGFRIPAQCRAIVQPACFPPLPQTRLKLFRWTLAALLVSLVIVCSWNVDPAKRKVLPGNQFPVDAYTQFVKQNVPRWTTTDDLILDAYSQEIEKVCPCVILVHSQAGKFGFDMAQKHPDKVKALIAVEPAAVGDPKLAAKLAGVPVLMLYGDYIETDSRWPTIRQRGMDFAKLVREAGGTVDVVNLPERGIKGNSHMIMMDRNSDEVAALIQTWLAEKKLYR